MWVNKQKHYCEMENHEQKHNIILGQGLPYVDAVLLPSFMNSLISEFTEKKPQCVCELFLFSVIGCVIFCLTVRCYLTTYWDWLSQHMLLNVCATHSICWIGSSCLLEMQLCPIEVIACLQVTEKTRESTLSFFYLPSVFQQCYLHPNPNLKWLTVR